jgi:hypothetical protein
MASSDYRASAEYAASAGYPREDVRGTGWVAFAAIMLGLAGTWNVLEGIMAIGSSRVYVADSTFVFSDLNTWGWIIMFLGLAQLVAALAVTTGSELARWFGIGSAFVNSIGQLYFVPAYPVWALTMFAVDMLIIFALAVYAGKRLRTD